MSEFTKLLAFEKHGVFSFGAITEKKALKKSRISKIPTPDNLKVVYKIAFLSVSLGNNYAQAVNNRLIKEKKNPDFKSQETYTLPYQNSRIILKHKNKDQKYLRVYPNLCVSFWTRKEFFDSNGNHIPYSEFKELEKEYFSLPSENKKQGLDNPIIVNNYKEENVKWVKRGNLEIEKIKLDDFKKMLDSENIDPDTL